MYILDSEKINVFSGYMAAWRRKISRHENEYFCQMYYYLQSKQRLRPFRLWPQHSTFSTFLKVVEVKYWPLFSSSSLNWQCAKRPTLANLPVAA